MLKLVLLCFSQRTKLEVPSFITSKDLIGGLGQNFKKRVT